MDDERIETRWFYVGRDRPDAEVGEDHRRKDDDRVSDVEEIRVGGSGPLNA